MLALLAAMKQEVEAIKKHMVVEEASVQGGCQTYKGRYMYHPVVLVQTGLGKERAETATRFALEHYPVTTVISLGFAGGLVPKLKAGDIVLCSVLCAAGEPVGNRHLAGEFYYSDKSLLKLASGVLTGTVVRFSAGKSVTVEQMITKAKTKRALSKVYGAEVVDMESYWVARMATAHNIPFLSIRTISDTASESLPDFNRIVDSNWNWLWNKALLYFVLHPWQLVNLLTLYPNMQRARNSLTFITDRLVASL